ncbi:ferredoxin family 2Fe-2S iron-sulfur cluster binding protein [Kordiimonas sp. SCSIO 12610]|uniref:ferredoxin family 2Fe-2S iron-sulfur cluster binding protein n=1 Tax=Kordiimonas sp. SCSIO 12610 TaxID=2829597 RepID=UPI00210DC37C|nr:ferredoxin family 2Fe-2S iron-sulfur cluster binding protein [Kordiimonas sp. SCSIO 12610]UTW53860.1 ferredoxin family 2Fe-2S iron-sulfur cluster binding protein [Kordiimonas sp. SCSIO 12610]
MAEIEIIFVSANGEETPVKAEVGMSVLQLAHYNDIDMEGTCEGNMACSTCHVIMEQKHYDAIPSASEEEEEMLDFTVGLTGTSRLGCQVNIDDTMDGMKLFLPKTNQNMMGF